MDLLLLGFLDSCEIQNMGPPTQPTESRAVQDWEPSHGRGLSSALYMDSSGAQPSGEAPPSFPSSQILTMQDPVKFSTILNHIRGHMMKATPESSRKLRGGLCDIPRTVIEGRLAALNFIAGISGRLKGQNRGRVARHPEGSHSTPTRFALGRSLCSHLGCRDSSSPGVYREGCLFWGFLMWAFSGR